MGTRGRRWTALALAGASVWLWAGGGDAGTWRELGQAGAAALLAYELPVRQDTREGTGQSAGTVTEPPTEPPTQPQTEPPTEPVTEPPLPQLLEAPEEEPTQPPAARRIPAIDIDPDALELRNDTEGIELELGDYLSRETAVTLSDDGPQILIMHTHATEAYTMADGDDYTPSDTARTTDEQYNMIRVGEEMARVFADMGLEAVHDKTLYDYPGYNGSYARSLKGIASYLERYPTISVVLDVHRDALIAADGTPIRLTEEVDGTRCAQVMLVVGTDDGGLDHPNWRDNLALAARIQARMLMADADFPRAVNLRSQRFNQHMTAGSLLVEVGTSGNTLQEALAGARVFARATGDALRAARSEE